MNMKFAALLLFVGLTSATWCWEVTTGWDKGKMCPEETEHGQATDACCASVGGAPDSNQFNRGCDVTGTLREHFELCCIGAKWECTGIVD